MRGASEHGSRGASSPAHARVAGSSIGPAARRAAGLLAGRARRLDVPRLAEPDPRRIRRRSLDLPRRRAARQHREVRCHVITPPLQEHVMTRTQRKIAFSLAAPAVAASAARDRSAGRETKLQHPVGIRVTGVARPGLEPGHNDFQSCGPGRGEAAKSLEDKVFARMRGRSGSAAICRFIYAIQGMAGLPSPCWPRGLLRRST